MPTRNRLIVESSYPLSFRQDAVGRICQNVKLNEPFSLIGVKDNCKINLQRFITFRPDVQTRYLGSHASTFLWVMVDLNELMDLSLVGFYHLLGASLVESVGRSPGHWEYLNHIFIDSPALLFKALKEDLIKVMEQTGQTLVVWFNNFNLARKFDLNLVSSQLLALREATGHRIVFGFTGNRPFANDSLLFNQLIWMTPFTGADAVGVVERNAALYQVALTQRETGEIISGSGGHAGLIKFMVQARSRGENMHCHPDIGFQCDRILQSLTEVEKAKLRAGEADDFLTSLGLLTGSGKRLTVFSPILGDYLISHRRQLPVYCWDEENDEVYVCGQPVKSQLSDKEFKLLKLLISHKGQVVSRDQMMDEVWSERDYPTNWALDKLVSRLREKLNTRTVESGLKVVRNLGITLED